MNAKAMVQNAEAVAQNEVISRYIFHIEHIKAMLEGLTEYAEDFGGVAPDDINWANVGTVAEMAQQLRNVCEFAGVHEEVTA